MGAPSKTYFKGSFELNKRKMLTILMGHDSFTILYALNKVTGKLVFAISPKPSKTQLGHDKLAEKWFINTPIDDLSCGNLFVSKEGDQTKILMHFASGLKDLVVTREDFESARDYFMKMLEDLNLEPVITWQPNVQGFEVPIFLRVHATLPSQPTRQEPFVVLSKTSIRDLLLDRRPWIDGIFVFHKRSPIEDSILVASNKFGAHFKLKDFAFDKDYQKRPDFTHENLTGGTMKIREAEDANRLIFEVPFVSASYAGKHNCLDEVTEFMMDILKDAGLNPEIIRKDPPGQLFPWLHISFDKPGT
jgi:hypothetical protein